MASIRQWQEWVAADLTPDLCWMSPLEVWNRFEQHAANVARAMRRLAPWTPPIQQTDELRRALGWATVWTFAFCAKLGFDLEDAVWHKFPAACPYCVLSSEQWPDLLPREAPVGSLDGQFVFDSCDCKRRGRRDYDEVKKLIGPLREQEHIRPKTLDGWQRMFRGIYGPAHQAAHPAELAFHLHEEVGEVSLEIENRDFDRCRDEVVDLFSWLLSLASFTSSSGEPGIERILRSVVEGP